MYWIQIIIFLLLLSSLLSLFGVRFSDFLQIFSPSRKSTLRDDMDILLGKPAKGFFNREILEVEQLLAATGRAGRFSAVKRICLLLFILGALLAILFDNPFMVPILGAGFAFAPIWYLRSTATIYKKNLNEELETAISVITTSYLRSGDLLAAVKENLPYLNAPVKGHFENFITESEMLNANMISTLNNLKMKIPNQIFHEWCNTLIQCQSDRTIGIEITVLHFKFHAVTDAAFDPKRFVWSAMIRPGNLIHSKESKSVDLTQNKRLGLYNIQCLISEMFVNLTDFLRCYLEWSKIGCKISDRMTVIISHKDLI